MRPGACRGRCAWAADAFWCQQVCCTHLSRFGKCVVHTSRAAAGVSYTPCEDARGTDLGHAEEDARGARGRHARCHLCRVCTACHLRDAHLLNINLETGIPRPESQIPKLQAASLERRRFAVRLNLGATCAAPAPHATCATPLQIITSGVPRSEVHATCAMHASITFWRA